MVKPASPHDPRLLPIREILKVLSKVVSNNRNVNNKKEGKSGFLSCKR